MGQLVHNTIHLLGLGKILTTKNTKDTKPFRDMLFPLPHLFKQFESMVLPLREELDALVGKNREVGTEGRKAQQIKKPELSSCE